MEKFLKELSDLRGISGFEYRINEQIKKLIEPYCNEVRVDSLGNIIALKKGKKSNKKIMLEAHMDEIGLMVSQIEKNGFLKFINIGGVDPRILPASEVTVHAKKDLKGVIGAKPPHLMTSGEGDKSVKITDMTIDTGLSYEEVCELVSVGDSVTLSQSVGKLLNDNISLKTLDDRAGVCAVIEVFKRVGAIDADLYASISTQEEVGLRGARVASFGIFPDMAIAIDVCHAVTPDNSKNAFEAGSGTVVTIGPNIHPKMSEKLFELAKKYDIKTNTDVDDGDTGTDAWAIQVTKTGVPTALLSIPLKYMHTSVETMNMSDFEATIALIEHFVKDSDDFAEDWLCY
ncbi:MAG: M42 family peptidase [Clostridia bacterium]|nr:M42 family peptidase [Clostridia bacterium]